MNLKVKNSKQLINNEKNCPFTEECELTFDAFILEARQNDDNDNNNRNQII
jgi:hypothetical protein